MLILEFLINAISIVESLSEFSCVLWGDSPSVKSVILELALINEFSLFVEFSVSVEFRIFELSFKNQLFFLLTVYFSQSIDSDRIFHTILTYLILDVILFALHNVSFE